MQGVSNRTVRPLKAAYSVINNRSIKPKHISVQIAVGNTDRLRIISCIGRHNYLTKSHNTQISRTLLTVASSFSYNHPHISNYNDLFVRQFNGGLLSSCFHHDNNCLHQKRHFSADTYYKYFSPEFPPIGFAQNILEQVHDLTGLPWWASILFTTCMLRTLITLPLAVHAMKVITKVEMLQPEVLELSKELKKEVAVAIKKFGWQQKKARTMYNVTMKNLIRKLYVRDNCHPMKASVLALVQLPMWFCLSFALRNMSGAVPVAGLELPILCPDLITEGTLWFVNMTIPDATWIIPVSMGLFNLMNVEIHALERVNPKRSQKIITNVLRGISFLMIGIGGIVPSSMCLYWSFSSLFGVVQTLVFKSPRVKRALGIPKTPKESETPFGDLWTLAKAKYTWKK